MKILNLKMKQQDLEATERAKVVAIEVLSRARNRPNFGNAGEVELAPCPRKQALNDKKF